MSQKQHYEFVVLWLTDGEIDYVLNTPLLVNKNIPPYLLRTISQNREIKARPHIYNPVANIPDAFLPCLNQDKKTKCHVTGKIFNTNCLGIIIKGEDIGTIHKNFPGFITDFKLSPISV